MNHLMVRKRKIRKKAKAKNNLFYKEAMKQKNKKREKEEVEEVAYAKRGRKINRTKPQS